MDERKGMTVNLLRLHSLVWILMGMGSRPIDMFDHASASLLYGCMVVCRILYLSFKFPW